MKKLALAMTLLAALPLAASAQVSKEDLKKLAAAGISDNVILSYIKANGGVAKLSAEDVIELKQAGASEKLLSVALGTAQAPSAAPAPAPAPSTGPAYTTENYSVPSSTYVYDSTPYYYSPSASYAALSIGPLWPYYYYYPRYYNNCYPRNYSYSGFYGGRYYSRGYAGVSGFRSHR
jgi:hypothetical protein